MCRSRKTKCDNRRPVCGFCAATGGECSYSDDGQDHSRLDRGSLLILQRIGELEQSLAKLITETGASNSASLDPRSALSAPAITDTRRAAQPSPTPDSHNPSLRPKGEEVAPVAGFGNGQGDNPPTADVIQASTEMTVESVLAWPVFQPVLIEPYPRLLTLLGQTRRPTHTEDEPPYDRDFEIDAQAVEQLVANFLSSNHIKNPIFDVATLWENARLFLENGPRWDGRSCLVVSIPMYLQRAKRFCTDNCEANTHCSCLFVQSVWYLHHSRQSSARDHPSTWSGEAKPKHTSEKLRNG